MCEESLTGNTEVNLIELGFFSEKASNFMGLGHWEALKLAPRLEVKVERFMIQATFQTHGHSSPPKKIKATNSILRDKRVNKCSCKKKKSL